MNPCGGEVGEEASGKLDTMIFLATLFHMIEWIKWTVFLTSCLVNVNLLPLFKLLWINIPFGVLITLIAFIAGMGADEDCTAEGSQPERVQYLKLQIICFVVLLPFSLIHGVYMAIKGKDWC